ncbi:hypothetical protein NQ318_002605 [Aromia moschata]|uniref:Uncharacterized protein n=1 Tax=Aromia moschata TaxID=1265417 RepID=A0AAV8XYN4_9CUCU|nr:hypothetical protein NQ318_002605 [Aromia moschata]
MYRARRSIEKHSDCVLDENLFKWGYVLVNTRAVYVQPDLVRNMSHNPLDDVLAEEPKMALCPFLDMFNHHFLAANEAEIYGFYIPNNVLDTVKFELQEVLSVLKLNLDERQYKFLKDHNFDKTDDLYIGYEGISFALRAVLFVSFNETIRNYNSVVFGSYPEDFFEKLPVWTDKLLRYKSEMFQKDYKRMTEYKFNKRVAADHRVTERVCELALSGGAGVD